MQEPESLGQTLNATTEHMNDIVININSREMGIDSKKRKLEKIKNQEIERNKHLQLYLEQLSSQSALLKDAESQFIKERKEEDDKLSTEIQEKIANIDNNIQTLKKMQTEKAKNEESINQYKDKINQFDEELLSLEKKDLEAEQVLYELVTRPFTTEEITHEIQQSENTEKAAVEAILNLTLKTIHDLRQKISEEKKKRSILKDEFNTISKDLRMKDQISYEEQLNQLNDGNHNQNNDILLFYNPITGKVDMTEFNNVDSRVKSLKRKEKRIDKEIDEINSKKPLFYTKFNEKKLNIQKTNNEKQKYESKMLNFKVDFNPEYNNVLTSQISQVQTDKVNFEKKLKKSKQKLFLLENTENKLHKKLRKLTESEIETEQTSLKLASFENENHRIETLNSQIENEEKLNEQRLVDELSDLQKRIAMRTAEFDDMIQRHSEFEQTILNDADWQRSHLIPPELKMAVKHSNVADFGLQIRIPEPFNFSELSSNSSFLNTIGGSDKKSSSSYFSFTQSDKKSSQTESFKNKNNSIKNSKSIQKVDDSKSENFLKEANLMLKSVDPSLSKRIAKMKQAKEKVRRESIKVLAKVRSLTETKTFTLKEVKVTQAKLHQESFNLQKLQVELSRKESQNDRQLANHLTIRVTDEIAVIKDRIERLRLTNRERRNTIDHKTDILHRIEKVSSYTNAESEPQLEVHPIFVIQDGERVIDRVLARRKLCIESDRKVSVAKDTLDGFCEFYQRVREEQRKWYRMAKSDKNYEGDVEVDETDLLKKWIEYLQDSCVRFRNCGI